MNYVVRLIHPEYGEIRVIPDVLDQYQYEQLLVFAEKHDEVVVVEEMFEG